MATTISTAILTGLTLTSAGSNPISILASGTVSNNPGTALQSTLATYWTLTNAGSIFGFGTVAGADDGIALAGGAAIDNSGAIQGYGFGITLGGVGTVVNHGAIRATQTAGPAYTFNYVTKVLTVATAAVMMPGGGVSNAAGAIVSGGIGIALGGGGSLINAGTISGLNTFVVAGTPSPTTHVSGVGVALNAGGSVANAASGGIAGNAYGLVILGAAGTVTNNGSILGTSGAGVMLLAGGSVTNTGTGVMAGGKFGVRLQHGGNVANSGTAAAIAGGTYGVQLYKATGTVTNAGLIASYGTFAGAGIHLGVGGSVTNAASGRILARWEGIEIGGVVGSATTASTIINQGSISAVDALGNGADLWLRGPTYVLNDTSGIISGGPYGIVLYDQTTVVNRGFLGAATANPIAAIKQGSASNASASVSLRLEMAPAGTIIGNVIAPLSGLGQAANVLELLSGASAGTISSFGNGASYQFQNFGRVALDTGGIWSLGGAVTASQTIAFAGTSSTGQLTLTNPRAMGGTIAGFGSQDTIVLAGIADVTGVTLSPTGNVLTVSESAGPGLTLRFDPAQVFTGTFAQALAGTATAITLSCFAAGTSIRTDTGLVQVERLRTGMSVRTHRGPTEEIIWIGHRRVDCRRHPKPATVQPIRIQAGAFGPGLPSCDLRLSPEHAVFVQDVLIPIRCLINGTTIAPEDVAEVTYYHLELPAHDVILAEDLPVESYLDTGDRANFGNAGARIALFPDFSARIWEMAGCAPLVQTGPVLESVRRMLAAAARGIERHRRQPAA